MQIFYRDSIGLEISDYFINAVKLRKRGKKIRVIGRTSVQIPSDIDIFDDKSEAVNLLEKVKQKIHFDVEDILAVNLNPERVLFRRLSLPIMNKRQTINAARFQINRELMIPLEDIVIDVFEIERKNNMVDYGAFIARQMYIRALIDMLMKSGFGEPDVVDVDYLKYLYLIDEKNLSGYNFLVIESFAGIVVMMIINGKLSIVETSSMALDDIVNALVDNHGVTIDEALSIIKNGSEIGAFGKQINESLEIHYRDTIYEVEKLIRSIINSNEVPQNVKFQLFLLSINERLSTEFVKYAREIGLMGNSPVSTFPFKKNVPTQGIPLGALGLAYRGVMEIGKGEFVPKKIAEAKT